MSFTHSEKYQKGTQTGIGPRVQTPETQLFDELKSMDYAQFWMLPRWTSQVPMEILQRWHPVFKKHPEVKPLDAARIYDCVYFYRKGMSRNEDAKAEAAHLFIIDDYAAAKNRRIKYDIDDNPYDKMFRCSDTNQWELDWFAETLSNERRNSAKKEKTAKRRQEFLKLRIDVQASQLAKGKRRNKSLKRKIDSLESKNKRLKMKMRLAKAIFNEE